MSLSSVFAQNQSAAYILWAMVSTADGRVLGGAVKFHMGDCQNHAPFCGSLVLYYGT